MPYPQKTHALRNALNQLSIKPTAQFAAAYTCSLCAQQETPVELHIRGVSKPYSNGVQALKVDVEALLKQRNL